MIVVDLGCAAHGQWDSPHWLEEMFHPETIYGFDPTASPGTYMLNETEVVVENKAAWIADGSVEFQVDGTASCVVDMHGPLLDETMWRSRVGVAIVECFDFARWLINKGQRVTLKADIENAELVLLDRLIQTGGINLVDLLLIEWHAATPDQNRWKERLLANINCEVLDWGH